MSGSASLKPDLSASAPTPLSRLGSQCGCRHFEPVGGNYAHHNLAMCRPFIICARSLGHRRSGMPDLEIVRSGNQSLDGGADVWSTPARGSQTLGYFVLFAEPFGFGCACN